MDVDIYGEAPDKMTYTEQANKRTNCKRLTWYVVRSPFLLASRKSVDITFVNFWQPTIHGWWWSRPQSKTLFVDVDSKLCGFLWHYDAMVPWFEPSSGTFWHHPMNPASNVTVPLPEFNSWLVSVRPTTGFRLERRNVMIATVTIGRRQCVAWMQALFRYFKPFRRGRRVWWTNGWTKLRYVAILVIITVYFLHHECWVASRTMSLPRGTINSHHNRAQKASSYEHNITYAV